MSKHGGIACGGNWIIDRQKVVDFYPSEGALANILSESLCGGGCAYNVIINLAKFDCKIPLEALGIMGEDENAKYIFKECAQYKNINTRQLIKTKKEATSYTDVFNVPATGKRTFFHNRGANKLFGPEAVDISIIKASLFHLGYLLLLDTMDKKDPKYGTVAASFLHKLQKKGIKTSIDLVSEDSDRFNKIVPPALKYTNYCIINDFEAEKLTGIHLRKNGALIKENLISIGKRILDLGVNDLIVIHFPEGAYLVTKGGKEILQPSLSLPAGYIAGSTGAGDSFCSGILYGLFKNWGYEKILEFAVCAGAKNLSHISTTGGIGPQNEILKMKNLFPFRKI